MRSAIHSRIIDLAQRVEPPTLMGGGRRPSCAFRQTERTPIASITATSEAVSISLAVAEVQRRCGLRDWEGGVAESSVVSDTRASCVAQFAVGGAASAVDLSSGGLGDSETNAADVVSQRGLSVMRHPRFLHQRPADCCLRPRRSHN